jgi:hypothetical protein
VIPVFIREQVPVSELVVPNKRIVLAGDAVYPMSMFREEGMTIIYNNNSRFKSDFSKNLYLIVGGNHAMVDAGNLATEIFHYN